MDEIEFGKVIGELTSTGHIASTDDIDDFVKTVEKMRRILNAYYWDDNSQDVITEDDVLLTIWESLKSHEVIGKDNAVIITNYIVDLIEDLNEGDYDDAFGSSGWRDMVFG